MDIQEQYKDTTLPGSFVGKSGKFYVLRSEGLGNPAIPVKYAVRSNVDAYNNRSETPQYIPSTEALIDFSYEVKINPETLTTTWPNDRDESDLGVTPKRDIWHNRFQQAREGRSHAA